MIQQTYTSRHYTIMEVTQIGAASYVEEYPTKAAALAAAAALLAQYPEIVRVNIYFHWELNHHTGSRLAEAMTRRSATYRQHRPTNQQETPMSSYRRRKAAPPRFIKAQYAGKCAEKGTPFAQGADVLLSNGVCFCESSKSYQDFLSAEVDRLWLNSNA